MKKTHIALLLVLSLESYVFIPRIWRSHLKIVRLKDDLEKLGNEKERLDAKNKYIETQLKGRKEVFFIEKEARNKLGMKKKDEVIYKIKEI